MNKDQRKTCEYPRASTIDKEWENIEFAKKAANEAIGKRKNIEERKVQEFGMRRSKMPLKTKEQFSKIIYRIPVKKMLKHKQQKGKQIRQQPPNRIKNFGKDYKQDRITYFWPTKHGLQSNKRLNRPNKNNIEMRIVMDKTL